MSNMSFIIVKPNFVTYSTIYYFTLNYQKPSSQLETSSSYILHRSSPPKVFLRKGVPEICSKFTGEHPCRSVISIKLQTNFIKITLWHGCSPLNLLYIFRTPFPRNTSGWLLLITCFANVATDDICK